MSGSVPLINQEIIKIVLQHLDNETISRLLNKVPLKQGLLVLPDGASDNARNKAIQNLTLEKNLKYIISVLESGQYKTLVKRNYDNLKNGYNVNDFQIDLKKSHGETLDYLIYLISENKLAGLINFFNDDLVIVKEFTDFLKVENFNEIRFKRDIKPNKTNQPAENDIFQKKINKLENENNNLKRKMDREIAKINREFDDAFRNAEIDSKEKIAMQKEEYLNNITQIKVELKKEKKKLAIKTKEYDELFAESLKLKQFARKNEELNRPVILVIGNLSANSILDTQKYQIITLAKLSSKSLENIIKQHELFKIYIQSEYVSTGEYLLIKKRYPNIPLKYTTKDNMEKK
ncbi:hypothetical protein [Leuconostoc suionicum]|uniref:hypothetical protein n=1 Tax=Leuconostoc suionicum TaxID=1511761 RepID=UPI0021A9537D|nr:hypothetical protein [Leuconostoc suionicum]MCT4401897.1 hypothetical protein [Leuconostoc suionicum]